MARQTSRWRTAADPRGIGAHRPHPAPVEVLIGGRWLTAKAHAVRGGRRGAQVLITCYGRLVWITAANPGPRVERPPAHPVRRGQRRERIGILRQQARRTGPFDHTITLPGAVDTIEATLPNGVLTVHAPKAQAAKGRRIEITDTPPAASSTDATKATGDNPAGDPPPNSG